MPTAAQMRSRHNAKMAQRFPKRYADGGAVDGLPEGFTVDALPPGFSIDKPSERPTAGQQMMSAVTDIPSEIYQAGKSALSTIGDTLNPFSEARHAAYAKQAAAPSFMQGIVEGAKQVGETGKGILAVPELVASPITGTARSAIGHPFSVISGKPYEEAKSDVDLAMMGLAPSRGGLSTIRGPAPMPTPPQTGPLGVTLSEGQETGKLPLIQREQAALRGTSGAPAQDVAQKFFDQQRAQVVGARENVAKQLDPYGMQVAESPQEAGQIVSEAIQKAAASRKAGVANAYEAARGMPGEVHAGVFEGIGQKIKGDLSLRPEPVIIDDKLTPFASRAIQDVEDRVSKLFIQNRADPFGPPNPQNITGVNLAGVDQMRKRLSAFRKDAYSSGNAADGRAAQAVLDSFDTHVDNAINNGLFSGDKRAVQAWNDARAAYADYRKTFTAGKNDPTGRVVEKIIGKNNNPAAIPNDVADFLYGSSGVNPNSLNVNVANRIGDIIGRQSPEWSAVKQGLFSRLIETPQGVTDYGPGKVAQRINKFLNGDGKELAQALYSAPERDLLQRYANLQRQLEVPQSGANWSNTATFTAKALKNIGTSVGLVVGSALGHAVGLPWGVAEGVAFGATKLASKMGEVAQARAVAKQLPMIVNATRQYQKALQAAQKANSPLSSRAVSIAGANLARSLEPLGIKLENLGANLGAVNAPAENNEKE